MAGKTGLTVNGAGIGNSKSMTIGSTTSSGNSRKHNAIPTPLSGSWKGNSGFPVERNVTAPTSNAIGRPPSTAEIQASDHSGTNSDRLQRTFTVVGSMRGRPLQNGISQSWAPKREASQIRTTPARFLQQLKLFQALYMPSKERVPT